MSVVLNRRDFQQERCIRAPMTPVRSAQMIHINKIIHFNAAPSPANAGRRNVCTFMPGESLVMGIGRTGTLVVPFYPFHNHHSPGGSYSLVSSGSYSYALVFSGSYSLVLVLYHSHHSLFAFFEPSFLPANSPRAPTRYIGVQIRFVAACIGCKESVSEGASESTSKNAPMPLPAGESSR